MAKTISGGRYQSPDGSWHDAEGRPVDAPEIEQAENEAPDTPTDDAQGEQAATTETKRKRK